MYHHALRTQLCPETQKRRIMFREHNFRSNGSLTHSPSELEFGAQYNIHGLHYNITPDNYVHGIAFYYYGFNILVRCSEQQSYKFHFHLAAKLLWTILSFYYLEIPWIILFFFFFRIWNKGKFCLSEKLLFPLQRRHIISSHFLFFLATR